MESPCRPSCAGAPRQAVELVAPAANAKLARMFKVPRLFEVPVLLADSGCECCSLIAGFPSRNRSRVLARTAGTRTVVQLHCSDCGIRVAGCNIRVGSATQVRPRALSRARAARVASHVACAGPAHPPDDVTHGWHWANSGLMTVTGARLLGTSSTESPSKCQDHRLNLTLTRRLSNSDRLSSDSNAHIRNLANRD